MLSSVSDVQSRVGIVGKSLGYGDLLIMGPGGEKASDRFTSISHPTKFRDELMSAAHSTTTGATAAARRQRRSREPGRIGARASRCRPRPSPMSSRALTKLAQLRDAGAISPEEYEAKKAEILSRV